ncbi:MAG: hypothetical protein LBT13_03470 [Treponema sp.]|jgi:low affinity Fe/Cu permease|nr:hypothetical protein [Treponema sp.]
MTMNYIQVLTGVSKWMKNPWCVPVLLGIILLWAGCGTTETGRAGSDPGLSLDAGIAPIARDIERSLPLNTWIVNFETPSAKFSNYVRTMTGLLLTILRLSS